MRHCVKDWLLLLTLVVMWGSAFLLNQIALGSFPPTTLVAFRLIIGAIVLIIAMGWYAIPWHSSPKLLAYFLAMAIIGNALPYFLIAWGQQYVSSGLAGILMAVMPLATLFLAHFFIPSEPLNTHRVIGFVFGFAGIVVLMGPQSLLEVSHAGTTLLAQLAILGGALCYALGTIIARLRPESDDLLTATMVLIFAGLVALPTSLVVESPWISPLSVAATASITLLGLVATGLATVVYFKLLRSAGATFLAQMNYLIPVWALAAGAVFLNEQVTPKTALGLVIILLGIAISQNRQLRK
ncbi:MAG: EamA/RhaT family transporter [Thiothrix sp.]|nr:MAG: EamA/RhaT family transporter [Thiothrix sp.]